METVIFWILSAFAVAVALAVVFFKRAVNGVMSLLALMLALAGLYVLMGAPLVAFFQVIVYVGAVLVLFAFVIMLLNLKESVQPLISLVDVKAVAPAVLFAVGIVVLTWLALRDAAFSKAAALQQPVIGLRQIALDLFTKHLLVFELASVVLLVAAVAAIVISRKEGERP
ncbi:MAG TPA: NADH-quinone oxidoreductase subunit J [Syntrophus sp. (in: bacteria)]|nr:NADH-quinone oxidoreductase subunit J [Syntrophus sp. (in: bacteria)]